MDTRNLKGRLAVVTGAASGIGRATALALARRGADLALCDVDEAGLRAVAEEVGSLGSRAVARRADVSSEEQMQAFADAVHAEFPAADLLVNNAGIAVAGTFLDLELADFDRVVAVNLRGVVLGCRVFLPAMAARGSGHVVNIASMAGYTPSPGMTPYTATKFAVVGFSESLRLELAPLGIGVTAICPGIINTPIVRNSPARGALAGAVREEAIALFERRNYPPERVAEALLDAVARNRAIAPVSPEARVAWWIRRLAPGLLRGLAARSFRSRLAPPAGSREATGGGA